MWGYSVYVHMYICEICSVYRTRYTKPKPFIHAKPESPLREETKATPATSDKKCSVDLPTELATA